MTAALPTTAWPRPRAWAIAARVTAPDLPGVTIAECGILRDVVEYDQGDVHVQLACQPTPQRSEDALLERLIRALSEEGFRRVDVELVLP